MWTLSSDPSSLRPPLTLQHTQKAFRGFSPNQPLLPQSRKRSMNCVYKSRWIWESRTRITFSSLAGRWIFNTVWPLLQRHRDQKWPIGGIAKNCDQDGSALLPHHLLEISQHAIHPCVRAGWFRQSKLSQVITNWVTKTKGTQGSFQLRVVSLTFSHICHPTRRKWRASCFRVALPYINYEAETGKAIP